MTFDSSTQAVPAEALLDEARALSAMIVSPSGKDQSGVAVDYLEARIDYTLP